jgi:hypothetical protein
MHAQYVQTDLLRVFGAIWSRHRINERRSSIVWTAKHYVAALAIAILLPGYLMSLHADEQKNASRAAADLAAANAALGPAQSSPPVGPRRKNVDHAAELAAMPGEPIEGSAAIFPEVTRTEVNGAAAMVRAHGYRCDSVSFMRANIFGGGFVLSCDGHAHNYDVDDRDAQWNVSEKSGRDSFDFAGPVQEDRKS